MIIVRANLQAKEIQAQGHAELVVEVGKGIETAVVCAAVSTAFKITSNILSNSRIAHVKNGENGEQESIKNGSGYMYLKILSNTKPATVIFESLVESLKEMSEEFPNNITVVLTPSVTITGAKIKIQTDA